MGICASCLGRDRHPSREVDESDPLLDDTQTVRYGAVGAEEVAQPDEEELEREREALNRITMQATESMIDVLHPDGVTISHHLTPNSTLRHKNHETASQSTTTPSTQEAEDAEDAEEQAWLDSITSTEPGSVTHIKALHKGALVMDIGQLRESAPPPSARKASKAAIRM